MGIQSFEEIRSEYIYVDKTKYVYELINSGKVFFFSRPRRFGKSLLVNTLKCLFEGRKELFEGLWIYDKWDWDEKYPVVKLDMSTFTNSTVSSFETDLKDSIFKLYENFGVPVGNPKVSPKKLIQNLIESLKEKVVVLVDEYDKPILDNVENRERAAKMRDYLRGFYEIFKSLDEHIKFLFITGVTKFSRVSLFSGLNNLEDVSLYPRFAALVGYTENEIIEYFKDYLEGVDIEQMRYWYNGYNFLGSESVYNPYDVLLFLKSRKFDNYWFETGTPSFLVKVLEERQEEPNLARLENATITSSMLDAFDVHVLRIEPLLFQTGYLTIEEEISDFEGTRYKLRVPNYEVRKSLNKELLFSYLKAITPFEEEELSNLTKKAMIEGNVEKFIESLRALFGGLPYQAHPLVKYEGYYQSVLYAYLNGAGLEVIAEDYTSRGRVDLTVKLPKIAKIKGPVYIIELKVVESEPEGKALKQIKEKRYHEKYVGEDVYLIGVEVSKSLRGVVYAEWEKAGSTPS